MYRCKIVGTKTSVIHCKTSYYGVGLRPFIRLQNLFHYRQLAPHRGCILNNQAKISNLTRQNHKTGKQFMETLFAILNTIKSLKVIEKQSFDICITIISVLTLYALQIYKEE